METAIKERLIGAAVLVVVVVLGVPALLKGPRPPATPPAPASGDMRVVEIDLTGRASAPEPEREDAAAAPETAAPPVVAASATPEPVVPAPAPASETAAPAVPVGEAPTPAVATAGWAVQVAALSRRDGADTLVAELKRKGYAAFVVAHRADGEVLYRVRVGPEVRREQADRLAGRLRDDGYKPAVVAHP